MKYLYLGLYRHFSCLQGACPSTCCAGWSIRIDSSAEKRFREISDPGLREDILQNLCDRVDGVYFRNRPDGRCAMLDEDGLCRIWRHTEEAMLCLTCRKYPKLIGSEEKEIRLSMAASCPVVADYLCREELTWFFPDEQGEVHTLTLSQLESQAPEIFAPLHDFFPAFFTEVLQKSPQKCYDNQQMHGLWNRIVRLHDFATDILEILQQTERLSYLEGSFDYFAAPAAGAQALCEELAEYEQSCGQEIQAFLSRYLPYRLYTVLLERPEEKKECRARQVFGEAVVWYVIHLSRFYSLKDRPEAAMPEEIAWMYRFCVHSILREQAFCNMLEQSFPQPERLMELIW